MKPSLNREELNNIECKNLECDCVHDGHEFESIGTIDKERINNKLYHIVEFECIHCKKTFTEAILDKLVD